MTSKTIEQRITEAEALLAELKRDAAKPMPVSDGRPEIGQDYWFIDGSGNILHENWAGAYLDRGRLAIGNVFLTTESAEREVERRKVIKIDKDFSPRNFVDAVKEIKK